MDLGLLISPNQNQNQKFFSNLSTAPYLHYGRNFMRLEVLLYSQLVLTHVDGLPIRARCFWQKRKAFDGIADDIRDYHFNGTAYYFFRFRSILSFVTQQAQHQH